MIKNMKPTKEEIRNQLISHYEQNLNDWNRLKEFLLMKIDNHPSFTKKDIIDTLDKNIHYWFSRSEKHYGNPNVWWNIPKKERIRIRGRVIKGLPAYSDIYKDDEI